MIFGFGKRTGPPPALSVVVAWRDRPELARMLTHNRARLPDGTEIVVVNCGGDAAALESLARGAGVSPAPRLINAPVDTFNKCLALNLGVHFARAPLVFLLDADVLIDDDFVTAAMARAAADTVITVDRVVEEHPEQADPNLHLVELAMTLRLEDRAGARAAVDINRARFDDFSRSAPGLALLQRRHFIAAGGMNAALTGWGWEDLDLIVRLQLGGALAHERMGRCLHMTHSDELRAIPPGSSRQQSEGQNFGVCIANYRGGHYLGTFEQDVERHAARCVEAGRRS